MYAIIKAGGKQFRAEKDAHLKVDLLAAEAGSEVEFKDVLLIVDDDKIKVGTPFVENAVVKAEVIGDMRDRKIDVFKKLPRKGFKRLRGHRQPYTLLKVKEINFGG